MRDWYAVDFMYVTLLSQRCDGVGFVSIHMNEISLIHASCDHASDIGFI